LAELVAQSETDPIVNSDDPALAKRLVQPSDTDFKLPKYPDARVSGEVVVAFVVERDGVVSLAKVVWSYGPAALGQVSLTAVEQARYEKPGLLDKKAARVFTYRLFTFFNGT
jgi:TonB family protein